MQIHNRADQFTAMKSAAQSALKFFTDKKSIKSTNNPLARTSDLDQEILTAYRTTSPDTLSDAFKDASKFGIGNCDEKGRMVYMSLNTNPLLHANGLVVSLCESVGYDHVFTVITTAANGRVGAQTQFDQLGDVTMVVDGWTEDWYCPNIWTYTAIRYGVFNVHNPRQAIVQLKTITHDLQEYGGVGGTPTL